MRFKNNEIYFDSRKEALSVIPWLQHHYFTAYECSRCGLNFASKDASTDTGAIICGICEGEVLG